jgi:hypothetical protein
VELPWWDTLHAWWSEQPKYSYEMITNSTTGIQKFTHDLEEAVAGPSDSVLKEEDGELRLFDEVCRDMKFVPGF